VLMKDRKLLTVDEAEVLRKTKQYRDQVLKSLK
jgi:hypothetical protein